MSLPDPTPVFTHTSRDLTASESPTTDHNREGEIRIAAIIYNPIKVDLDTLRPLVETAEANAGWQHTQWFPTSEEDPGSAAARDALEAGADLLIAAGGDGTVRAVAEALRGHDAALALLPSGTGNLLARNLELTLDDAEHSLAVAFTGEDRAVDLGMIHIRHGDGTTQKRAFLVMAGLGIDAQMIANTDDELKKKASWLAYVDAIRRSLRDKNQLRMRFRLDKGESATIRAHTIIIGNCGSLPANILLLPDAAIDDGVFDIVLLRPEGFIGWLTVAVKVFWENGVLRRSRAGRKLLTVVRDIPAVRYQRGSDVDVVLGKPHDIELDGDAFGTASAFHAWIEPDAIRIRVPAAP